jgi:AraC-like DNA-binding protein/quercetin dioxygenase-like cupin family protein
MKARTHRVQPHRSAVAGMAAMTLVSDHRFPRHSHDELGIGIMLSGAQRSWSVVGQVEAQAGDVIMVNPGEMHDGAPVGAARGWRIIYIDPALATRATGEENEGRELVVRPVARDRRLAADVAGLFASLGAPGTDPMAGVEKLLACVMRISGRHCVGGPRSVSGSPSVARAVQRLDDAPADSPSLADLAAESGVSRFQLLRGFAREVGTTPHAYLVQRKARLARRLLASGTTPAEAAAIAGFADQSHMTRAFVRHFGITPGSYRRACAA